MAVLVQFDRSARWGETLVCEQRVRDALAAAGIATGATPRAASAALAPAQDIAAHRVRADSALFYFEVPAGWLGLLCEAGECVAFARDRMHWRTEGAGEVPAQLPAHDAFIDQLLELTGDVADDEA